MANAIIKSQSAFVSKCNLPQSAKLTQECLKKSHTPCQSFTLCLSKDHLHFFMWNTYLSSDPGFKLNELYRSKTAHPLKLLILGTTEYHQETEGSFPLVKLAKTIWTDFLPFLVA